jgi:hypothetical protein
MAIDLRSIANTAIQPINQDIMVDVWASTGYSIGPGLKQIPSYAAPLTLPAQIQALSNDELRQIDGLNISGVSKAIYIKGDLRGIVKPDSLGGDLVKWSGKTWLVVKVLESWPTWTKCVLIYQGTS